MQFFETVAEKCGEYLYERNHIFGFWNLIGASSLIISEGYKELAYDI